ncbi:2OG-Fe(II) oxygenase [Erythrobacter sp. JK5]|uniref:2OG-Fe(II) oxygenase n=1 Tax=Erythrobacter sp. JK5 TaxID=2829500 RepID=UPI001BA68F91|nr:2OG-Fe(II) oxygenase [Erythrobacter sp. JK5]QUL38784.1 2OG-Fe(II) oxygenase [Erythrobacter sp. JK5]
MPIRHPENAIVVSDGLLSEAEHEALWQFFLAQSFSRVHEQGLSRVYRLTDGESWTSESHFLQVHDDPSAAVPSVGTGAANPIMRLFQAMFATKGFAAFAAGFEPWTHIAFNCSLYPPGCGLGWHADQGHSGAFIYYVHPEWHDSWGGELLIEDPRSPDSGTEGVAPSRHREFYGSISQALDGGPGDGRFLAPVPNRLVAFRSGIRHMVKKVDSAAGEAFRAAISGFFTTKSEAD